MRKFSFSKGVSTALVAMALVTGLAIPVDAAKKVDTTLSQQDVTNSGAFTTGAPAISLKETKGSGQVTTAWTFNYSPVPAAYKYADQYGNEKSYSYEMHILVFDQGDRTKPVYGSAYTDVFGKKVFEGGIEQYYVDPVSSPFYKYEFTISNGSLTPGKKEVVAYIFDQAGYELAIDAAEAAADVNYDNAWNAWVAAGSVGYGPEWSDYHSEKALGISKADYMIASAPVVIDVASEASVSTVVNSTSIQFDMSAANATGYEISRKIGKKYKVIATVASQTYTDKGLESKKTYSYKVRPYYVNKTTNKTTYGKYTTVDATTKGSALNLQAKVNGKNKVELSWKKVAGATAYEIYRRDTSSMSTVKSKDLYNGFSSYTKVATLKKSKKKYVDKKVSANRYYSYIVRAVISKDKKVKGDKDVVIEQGTGVDLSFGYIQVTKEYSNATGATTVEWEKVYGASGYLVEVYSYNYALQHGDWVTYKTLGKNSTKITLPATPITRPDGTVENETEYRIRAYNGTKYGESYNVTTYYSLGNVQNVTAKATTNGIKVSWTPVAGAAYYRVYRVPTDVLLNDKDLGGYATEYGTRVTEYVGASPATAVDVASWNAAVDASIAQKNTDYEAYKKSTDPNKKFDYDKYLSASDKLSTDKKYYYQNYDYSRSVFDANTTSIVDYVGNIYSGWSGGKKVTAANVVNGVAIPTAYKASYDPVVSEDNVKSGSADGMADAGVSYTYYVVATMATAKTVEDYKEYSGSYDYFDQAAYDAAEAVYDAARAKYDQDMSAYWTAYYEWEEKYENNEATYEEKPVEPEAPVRPYYSDFYRPYDASYYLDINTTVPVYNRAVTGPAADSAAYVSSFAYVIDESDFKNTVASTSGVKKVGQASYTTVKALKKAPTVKSISSSKGKVTLKIKKKVKGAKFYKIYRSTKKKGKYTSVGTTKTLKFTDSGMTKGKTYYYKVVPVVKNEANADVEGKASKVKSVKVK